MSALARILLIAGVALSASAGAQLSAPTLEVQATLARASLAEAALATAERDGAKPLSTVDRAAAEAAVAARAVLKKEPPLDRVWSWGSRAGLLFLLGLALLIAGGLLARRVEAAQLGESGSEGGAAGAGSLEAQLKEISNEIEALCATGATLLSEIGGYPGPNAQISTLQAKLSTLSAGPVAELGEQRRLLQHKLGLRAFATLFSELSGAERNLNRAWSALTDGHLGEAQASLERARDAMHRCQALPLG